MKFEKVYIISYVYNHKKRKRISNYLIKELGITNFEFVYGIDPSISNIKDINIYDKNIMTKPYKFKDAKFKNNTYYLHGISCGLAHLTAYQLALSDGYKKILIIEDDSLFIKDKNLINEYFNNIPKKANIIYYGYIKYYKPLIKYNNLYYKIDINNIQCNGIGGLPCYAICNRKTLINLIQKQKNIFNIADQYINYVIDNCYIAINKLCKDPIYK